MSATEQRAIQAQAPIQQLQLSLHIKWIYGHERSTQRNVQVMPDLVYPLWSITPTPSTISYRAKHSAILVQHG